MQKQTNDLSIEIPEGALTIQHFLNTIKEPVRTAFQDITFSVFGDVDRVTPWNGCYYLNLIEKASSYTYTLKIFIPSHLVLKNNFEIRPKMKLLVIGNVALNKNEMQLNAAHCEDLGYSRLHKQVEEWKRTHKPIFDREKKQLPFLCKNIAVVSNHAIQGFEDFNKHLTFGNLTIIETKMQGDKVAEDIAAAIREIQASNEYDCIVIVRGGGSFADLYEFNKPVLLEAIAASRIPVATAVGHETDYPLCDFAADIRYSTPTHAGKELTKRMESLSKNVSDWIQALTNTALLKVKAIEGKLEQLTSQICSTEESYMALALQKVDKQREYLRLSFAANIDKRILALNNYSHNITYAFSNALLKGEQKIRHTLGQIENNLRNAQEKEIIKRKHKKIFWAAAIAIIALLVIILMLLKSIYSS